MNTENPTETASTVILIGIFSLIINISKYKKFKKIWKYFFFFLIITSTFSISMFGIMPLTNNYNFRRTNVRTILVQHI